MILRYLAHNNKCIYKNDINYYNESSHARNVISTVCAYYLYILFCILSIKKLFSLAIFYVTKD